MIKTQQNKIVS